MTARDRRQVDLTLLGARLDALADFAIAAQAPPDWVESIVAELLGALLNREDPRRKKALALGRRMQAARDSGSSISEISQEFRRTPRSVVRLLGQVSRERVLATLYRPRRTNGGAT